MISSSRTRSGTVEFRIGPGSIPGFVAAVRQNAGKPGAVAAVRQNSGIVAMIGEPPHSCALRLRHLNLPDLELCPKLAERDSVRMTLPSAKSEI
jgi:hypothetical protein